MIFVFLLALIRPVGASKLTRLRATRYLASPSSDRPLWPSLPASFNGPVTDAAMSHTGSAWLLSDDGSVWCCSNSSDLGSSCASSSQQLSGGASRVVSAEVGVQAVCKHVGKMSWHRASPSFFLCHWHVIQVWFCLDEEPKYQRWSCYLTRVGSALHRRPRSCC